MQAKITIQNLNSIYTAIRKTNENPLSDTITRFFSTKPWKDDFNMKYQIHTIQILLLHYQKTLLQEKRKL